MRDGTSPSVVRALAVRPPIESELRSLFQKPCADAADTIPGSGVSRMTFRFP